MKTIAKYLLAIGILALAVSCENPLLTNDSSDAEMVEVTMSVTFPEPLAVSTKAPMGEGPTADAFDIHLCVYGPGDGYVQNWIKPLSMTKDIVGGFVVGGTFKVLLPVSKDQRTIHIIANPPASVVPTTSDYIDNVMEKMVTKLGTEDECSYWQQVVLDKIDRGSTTGSTGLPVASSTVQAAFSNVHLVRNFAKMVVTSGLIEGGAKFEVKRWTLINVPDMAYVAPYTGNDDNRFPSGYLNVKNLLRNHDLFDQLTNVDKYPGYLPPRAKIDETFPDDLTKYAVRDGAQYMYERPLPTTTHQQTAVLMEVTFSDDTEIQENLRGHTYWYKIEILDDNLDYIPFLRDIVYTLDIQDLKEPGYETAEAAYNGAYFGNISASLETAGLNEISDSKSLIHVDRMDYTYLTGGTTVILTKDGTQDAESADNIAQFYFVPDITVNPETPGYAYTHSEPGVCDIQVELVNAEGEDPAVTACTAGNDGSITIVLADTDINFIKKSIIKVKGRKGDDAVTNVNKYIYREITITLMTQQDFKHGNDAEGQTAITNTPDLSAAGNPVNFRICLPEGLSASAFPIQVRIEAENNSLHARTNDLPVATGPSVFDSKKISDDPATYLNTYYFIYTINFSDYRTLDQNDKYKYTYSFNFTMYTSNRQATGAHGNSTTIDLRDLGGKFKPMTLTLGTP